MHRHFCNSNEHALKSRKFNDLISYIWERGRHGYMGMDTDFFFLQFPLIKDSLNQSREWIRRGETCLFSSPAPLRYCGIEKKNLIYWNWNVSSRALDEGNLACLIQKKGILCFFPGSFRIRCGSSSYGYRLVCLTLASIKHAYHPKSN